jgi:tRNA(Ile2) C34 agmatinyltransferase TiaS
MKHVVVYESHICPKCLKQNSGSAGAILDLLICPECVEKYKTELIPEIEKIVRDYFKPEYKNREIIHIISISLPTEDHCVGIEPKIAE